MWDDILRVTFFFMQCFMVTMNNNRATPTLTGMHACAQTGAFDQVKATSLAIYGDGLVTGTLVTASAFGGACITSALNSASTTTAASAAALSNVYASTAGALTSAGASGTITGGLTVIGQLNASNVSVLGSYETVRAYETHTSNIVIENEGTGPALKVIDANREGGPRDASVNCRFTPGPLMKFIN